MSDYASGPINSGSREISVTGTSGQTTLPTGVETFELHTDTIGVHVRFGSSPTAVAYSAGTGDYYVPPSSTATLHSAGAAKIALVAASATTVWLNAVQCRAHRS